MSATKTALAAVALSIATVVASTRPAAARAGGIVTDTCQACHSGDAGSPALSLTPDSVTFNPGDVVTFTLAIRTSSVKVGGAFITSGGVGALRTLAGEGLKVNGQGLTHTAPKPAVNGAVSFRFAWQAPAKPGGLDIRVAALAGNGNNSPLGDAAGRRRFPVGFWLFRAHFLPRSRPRRIRSQEPRDTARLRGRRRSDWLCDQRRRL